MKNITALAVLVTIILSFSSVFSAHCQEEDGESGSILNGDNGGDNQTTEKSVERTYSFSFGTQFGFIYGQVFELVYPAPGYHGELLSELIWDVKPVLYYGFQLDFGRIDIMKGSGFFASVSFKAGVPSDSGIMEDRDWQSIENNALTNYSRHTNKTNEYYSLDAAVGASIPLGPYLYLKPYISGSWTRFSFTGRDGFKKYARGKTYDAFGYPITFYPIDDNPDEETLSGDVIRYQQDWLLLAAGFSIGTKILYPFSFELSFQISPLTYCAAIDNHLDESKRKDFYDFSAWGLFLEPRGRVSYNIERVEFSFETAFRYIGRTRGASFEKIGGYYYSNGEAGAGLSLFDMRFLVKLRL